MTVFGCGLIVSTADITRAQSDSSPEEEQATKQCLDLYRALKYDEALTRCKRAVELREKSSSHERPQYLVSAVGFVGTVYDAKGDYANAEVWFLRALAIGEKELGPEHLYVALSLNDLGLLYWRKGELSKAEPLYQRALAIREKALGADHAEVAISLTNLGGLYLVRGDYAKAEPFFLRALAIYEKANGPEGQVKAALLNNLGALYSFMGDYARAESFHERALAIREKQFGAEHPAVAQSLSHLAGLFLNKGDYKKTEELLTRALAIREKALGPEHPDVAESLNGLGNLYTLWLDPNRAEPLYLRALSIREKVFGPESPAAAEIMNNLAYLYRGKRDDEKSAMWNQQVLKIYEKTYGPEHPLVARSLQNLATIAMAAGDYVHAIEYETRALAVTESNLAAVLGSGSERQKQLFIDTVRGETDAAVSLHTREAPANAQAAQLALTTILRRKGRALDAMTDQIASLRRRATPEDVKLLDDLAVKQSQLANLKLSNDTRLPPREKLARITRLETEIEKTQGDISRRSAEFRALTQPVTLNRVRTAIPRDAALIELFAYQPYVAKETVSFYRYQPVRYVAYILKPTDESPQFVDLGEAAPIDTQLKLWREALLDPSRTDTRNLGRQVDERIMRPIRKLLGNTKRLFISPDGALNLIPFAALVDENDKYLLETYDLNYLTSGRDLLKLQTRSENHTGAVIFANPTYNLTGKAIAACESPARGRGLALNLSAGAGAASDALKYLSIDFANVCYTPLKGTAEEAKLVNAVVPKATVLTEKQATEAALKQLHGPAVLHVATHGFFLPDETKSANTNLFGPATVVTSENPLLRSGLIMAGANQRSSGAGEDGVLTAAEVAGLSLWGTKLVVLSACETGLGDVVNGAGVYGLRRALVLAGSETQVMSLWQVDDDATRDLMSDYYARLEKGQGRSEAMRSAQLAMLRADVKKSNKQSRPTQAHTHPYYWAPFISSGDWRTLDGKDR